MQSKVGVRGQIRINYGTCAVIRRGELHLVMVAVAVYNLECTEWVTANITLPPGTHKWKFIYLLSLQGFSIRYRGFLM